MMTFNKTTQSLHPGCEALVWKTKSLAGHWCCSWAMCGWQPLPLCGQRVTLGSMLFWGDTESLPVEAIRGVSWPRSQRAWCVLSKHLVQDKNTGYKQGQPSGRDPIVSPLLLNRHEREKHLLGVPELQGVLVPLVALSLNVSHRARSQPQRWPQVTAIS